MLPVIVAHQAYRQRRAGLDLERLLQIQHGDYSFCPGFRRSTADSSENDSYQTQAWSLHLVEHKITVRRSARPIGRKTLVGEHIEATPMALPAISNIIIPSGLAPVKVLTKPTPSTSDVSSISTRSWKTGEFLARSRRFQRHRFRLLNLFVDHLLLRLDCRCISQGASQ